MNIMNMNINKNDNRNKPNAVFVSIEKHGGGELCLDFSKSIIHRAAEIIGYGCNSIKRLYFPYGEYNERVCLLYDAEGGKKENIPTFPIYKDDGSVDFIIGGYIIVGADINNECDFRPLPGYIINSMIETEFTRRMFREAKKLYASVRERQ